MASHSGQLTRYARVADHSPLCSRTRRAWPAQFGHSMRSFDRTSDANSTEAPQSGHSTSGTKSETKEPLETAPVEANDRFVIDGDDRNSRTPRSGDQLFTRAGVFGDVPGRERDTT